MELTFHRGRRPWEHRTDAQEQDMQRARFTVSKLYDDDTETKAPAWYSPSRKSFVDKVLGIGAREQSILGGGLQSFTFFRVGKHARILHLLLERADVLPHGGNHQQSFVEAAEISKETPCGCHSCFVSICFGTPSANGARIAYGSVARLGNSQPRFPNVAPWGRVFR